MDYFTINRGANRTFDSVLNKLFITIFRKQNTDSTKKNPDKNKKILVTCIIVSSEVQPLWCVFFFLLIFYAVSGM